MCISLHYFKGLTFQKCPRCERLIKVQEHTHKEAELTTVETLV